jgi:radical SAM protein with 4Fe4S-binding SPASM domain
MNPIIENKRGAEGEFFVNLFEWCNLACSFCWQDHNKWDGVEVIVERAYDILDRVKHDRRSHFIINLMGGELFADEIPDQTFEEYKKLALEVKKKFPSGKTFEINWVTNFVYDKIDRVSQLVEDLRSEGLSTKLTTSFDFAGRFNKHQKRLFRHNCYMLRQYLGTVSVVLTRPNIERMMKMKDEVFDEMYRDGFYFYFDYYSPEKNFALNAPSDETLQKGLSYLIDNYPNVWPVAGWIRNDVNEMTCRGSMVIDHNGYQGQCRSLLTTEVAQKMTSKPSIVDNESMEEAFVEKYNCVMCEYYHRCGMGCFLQHDFKGKEELDECLYKGVFRKIDDAK